METYISFQFVALVMLLITIIFFSYKNWILVEKNKIYYGMILMEIVALVINILLCISCGFSDRYAHQLEIMSQVFTSISVLLIYFQILKYDLAMTGNILIKRKWWFKLLGLLVLLCVLTSVVPMVLGCIGFHFERMEELAMQGRMVQSVAIFACLVLASIVVCRDRSILSRREFTVLFGTNMLLIVDLIFERLMNSYNLASYYIIAFVFVVYYMLLHNIDRYRFISSGCFSTSGFRTLLWEKERYRENVRYLGICINNIESITNFCSEDEIVEIHSQLGTLLKQHCGRHQVFHMHSFEYVVTMKDTADVKKLHQELAEFIPSYIRINGKNVSLFCDFYTIDFRDADYHTGDFFGILASMRKIAMTYMDRSHLLCYSDESKNDIQKDMEAMRVVNTCIVKQAFPLQIYPIQSKEDEERFSYEFEICAEYGDGESISQELIWELAAQMGYHQEMGPIVFELVCKYIKLNKLQDSAAERIHLNLEAAQISGEEFAREYIDCLERYQIPGEFICIEITMDQDVDYDAVERALVLLREKGVRILLDQFGSTVCSLKTVLNMPFHGAKINHHMVKLFCDGISRQLVYTIDMLNTSGWKIILDGVDREEYIPLLKDLDYSYIQGLMLQRDFDEKQEAMIFYKIGGAAYD